MDIWVRREAKKLSLAVVHLTTFKRYTNATYCLGNFTVVCVSSEPDANNIISEKLQRVFLKLKLNLSESGVRTRERGSPISCSTSTNLTCKPHEQSQHAARQMLGWKKNSQAGAEFAKRQLPQTVQEREYAYSKQTKQVSEKMNTSLNSRLDLVFHILPFVLRIKNYPSSVNL